MSLAATHRGFRVTGWGVLASLVAFFVIVVGLDVYFATLAYRTYSGDVASNPYEAGIAFNRTLAQRKRESTLGWQVSIGLDRPGLVGLAVRDRAGAPLDGLTLSATLTRPATTRDRKVLVFRADGAGRYVATTGPLPGAWDLEAVATRPDGEQFEVTQRIGGR